VRPGPFLGVDIGTSATRVSLIDAEGTLLAGASRGYSTETGGRGEAEQDPLHWLQALRGALADIEGSRRPAAVGVCGQTPTVVPVGPDGKPVRPALTWQDTRAGEEAAELSARLGDPRPLIGTSLAWSPANMPAKLLWFARHEPRTLAMARWLLQPKDLVGLELTGRVVSDPWSSKGICKVSDGSPAGAVLSACGWPASACPPTAPAWERAGTVTKEAARRYGLPEGIPVSVGWSDALAEVLAAGCFVRESGFFFTGTSAIVGVALGGHEVSAPGLFSVPRSCAPLALCYGPTQSSGSCLAWAARLLGCRPAEVASLAGKAKGDVPTFVPYLSGERAPLWDPGVRAVLLGVSADHGPAEIARAVMEGVLGSARHILSLAESAAGARIEQVEVVGRGVGDAGFESLALQSLGATLRFHPDDDMSARGAAMLGAAAAGADLGDAARSMGDSPRTERPSAADIASSAEAAERYLWASEVATGWRRPPLKVVARAEEVSRAAYH
jgi:xylulokinase